MDLQCDRKIVRDDRILPLVSATASRNQEGVIHISLSNVSLDENEDIAIHLGDVKAKSVTGRILTADKIDAYNTFEQPDVVAPKEFKDAKITKDTTGKQEKESTRIPVERNGTHIRRFNVRPLPLVAGEGRA